MNILNKNMILIRSALNFSQREFADLAGVASSTVSAWELGNSVPRTKALTRISERVGISVDDLKEKELTTNDVVYPPITFPADLLSEILVDDNNEAIDMLVNICKGLSSDDIHALIGVARRMGR